MTGWVSGRWTQKAIAQVVAEERAEIGACSRSPTDPCQLADYHGLEYFPIDKLPDKCCRDTVAPHFLTTRQAAWSAALVPLGSAHVILANTSHSAQRRRVSLAHELGHFLLEHDFTDVLLTSDGCRYFAKALEKQADYFSCQLLLPDKDAVWAGFQDWSDETVASYFDVSVRFAGWRMSGARKIVQRYHAKHSSR